MYANYHTHTYLCRHANGDLRHFVENAINSGMKILGFSDHAPYVFSSEYHSGIRMEVSETEKYVNEIIGLREEYKKDIQIYIGYEMEYYPKDFERSLKNILHYECDYLIMGQHFLNNEYDGVYSGSTTEDKNVLSQYVNQVIEGMETGMFTYIAHPDLVPYRKDMDFYRSEMSRLCKKAKEKNIPLEINLLGIEQRRWYPFDVFWEIAAKTGNDVILGCDAHEPDSVGNKKVEDEGCEYAAKFGLNLLKDIELVKPCL